MKPANPTLAASGTTIFEAMSALARAHQAVNLGQGFPDDRGPAALRAAAAAYVVDGHNQYPPMMGMPALRQAVAAHDRRWYGLELDWESEVLVTSGATEALLDCFLALVEPVDEAEAEEQRARIRERARRGPDANGQKKRPNSACSPAASIFSLTR